MWNHTSCEKRCVQEPRDCRSSLLAVCARENLFFLKPGIFLFPRTCIPLRSRAALSGPVEKIPPCWSRTRSRPSSMIPPRAADPKPSTARQPATTAVVASCSLGARGNSRPRFRPHEGMRVGILEYRRCCQRLKQPCWGVGLPPAAVVLYRRQLHRFRLLTREERLYPFVGKPGFKHSEEKARRNTFVLDSQRTQTRSCSCGERNRRTRSLPCPLSLSPWTPSRS